ncbi:hypothetical protein [Pelagibacterium luteolum]|uniref:Uncharacterized protein n=1 Tax=Pelagibacterium luteolum TaxID=440168 RepID=A0A1G7VYF8_9HYPH|nr:hypothetical protein [Pelagibacterium luteolum]SDG64777.1 hypothetical protein SAMN04487974_10591 [Pelagibacterium luteolum]
MFIRIAWNGASAGSADPRNLKRLATTPRRTCDDLGVPAKDFANMTKGLFDRLG